MVLCSILVYSDIFYLRISSVDLQKKDNKLWQSHQTIVKLAYLYNLIPKSFFAFMLLLNLSEIEHFLSEINHIGVLLYVSKINCIKS